MLVFWKILRMYSMSDPSVNSFYCCFILFALVQILFAISHEYNLIDHNICNSCKLQFEALERKNCN